MSGWERKTCTQHSNTVCQCEETRESETITRILGLLPWSSECRGYHGGREQGSIPEGRLCLGATQTESWIQSEVLCTLGQATSHWKGQGRSVEFDSLSYLWVSLDILPSPSKTASRLFLSPPICGKVVLKTLQGTGHLLSMDRLLGETASSLRRCQFLVVLIGEGSSWAWALDSAWTLRFPGCSSLRRES